MQKYEDPKMVVIKLNNEDVITLSAGGNAGGDVPGVADGPQAL